MTIPSTPFRQDHTGNGVATSFIYDWQILDESHLRVVQQDIPTGIETVLQLNVDYSVSGVANPLGGNVIITPAMPSTKKITILPNVPYEQDTDFTNQNSVLPAEAEGMGDKLSRQVKQLVEKVSRAVTLPETSTESPTNYINEMNQILASTVAAKNAAEQAEQDAQTAEQGAVSAKDDAEDARDAAILARNAAQNSESNAAASELAAGTSESNAATSESNALLYKNAAESARDIADEAKEDAQDARDAAQLSQTAAATSATNANTSAGQANTARIASETARDLSQAWAEGHEPGGVGTKSSKEWSEESEQFRDEAQMAVGGTRVTVDDTTASVLNDKIVGGNGIATSVENPSGNEQLKLETYPTFDVYSWAKPYLVQSARKALTIKESTIIRLVVDGDARWRRQAADEVLNVESLLDTGSALTAGKDYYLYLCDDGAGGTEFVVSLNSTFPSGYTANNSRKIGGFHTLCVNAGTISGHPLSGYLAGEILPASVWCLNHRPHSNPEGMVYDESQDVWIDIYLQSGKGTNTRSIFGATVTDTRQYSEFMEDQFLVQKALLNDEEFASSMEGSNQQTAIAGSASPSPKTAGGHLDTAGRRMISNLGVEEGCGFLWQFLASTSASGGSSWVTINGSKGNVYGTCHVLLAGGHWSSGANCGSRSRHADSGRAIAPANVGGRGRSRARAIL